MSAPEAPATHTLPATRSFARSLRRLGVRLAAVERLLPAIFAAYAIPLAVFFAIVLPALRVPDEYWHFARAEQISAGGLLTWRQNSTGAGGLVDANVAEFNRIMSGESRGPGLSDRESARRVDASVLREAAAVRWGGERRFVNMHGIGPYPPFLYAASVTGIWTGKALRLSIASTLVLVRLLNAALAICIGVIALLLMPYARAALFTVLALPMTLHQFASASQDALSIALAALAAAVVARALHQRRPLRRGALIALCALIAAIAMARPPMLAAALPLLVPGLADARRWPRTGLLAAAAVSLIVFAWAGYVSIYARNLLGHALTPVFPMQQLALLLERPLHFFTLVGETWRISGGNLTRHFIGELGWFEVLLPEPYYRFMLVALGCAVLAALFERSAAGWRASAIVGAAVAAGALGLLLTIYLSWTPLGWSYIEGPQGRYFLPLALLLCAGIPALGAGALPRAVLTCIAAAAPLATLAVVPWAVVARYYLAPG